jgi:HAD superfamily hydrolase (TIGR01509 family)
MSSVRIAPILFDCDGVLVDSEPISCETTAELLRARGAKLTNEDVHRLFLGRSADDHRRHLASMGVTLEEDFGAIKDRAYIEKARDRLQPMKNARALLERLHGEAKMAVATSGTPEKVAFSLQETGLARFFDVVVSASEVARGKPFPDLFLRAAERLGVAPETCVVVEDSGPGIEAARAAGMRAVGLSSSISRDALIAAGAHVVIDDLLSLLAHLA